MRRGLLLFAHGARDAQWAAPFAEVARRIRAGGPDRAVELAYLEFMSPSLVEAGQRLVDAGCTTVDVLPLFLGAGGHVRGDVPRLLSDLAAAHPATQWRLHGPIGEAEGVLAAIAAEALRVLAAPKGGQ
jgi:sirohydrochlorin cobaltochelatase